MIYSSYEIRCIACSSWTFTSCAGIPEEALSSFKSSFGARGRPIPGGWCTGTSLSSLFIDACNDKTAARANLPNRLLTTASSDKKLYETLSLTTFEAGPGLDGRFDRIQAVAAVGPFVDDKVSGR